jgi:hypothetical protein
MVSQTEWSLPRTEQCSSYMKFFIVSAAEDKTTYRVTQNCSLFLSNILVVVTTEDGALFWLYAIFRCFCCRGQNFNYGHSKLFIVSATYSWLSPQRTEHCFGSMNFFVVSAAGLSPTRCQNNVCVTRNYSWFLQEQQGLSYMTFFMVLVTTRTYSWFLPNSCPSPREDRPKCFSLL